MSEKKKTYEQALAELEKLVTEIESPSSSLEIVNKDVKKAVELIEYSRNLLKEDEEAISKYY